MIVERGDLLDGSGIVNIGGERDRGPEDRIGEEWLGVREEDDCRRVLVEDEGARLRRYVMRFVGRDHDELVDRFSADGSGGERRVVERRGHAVEREIGGAEADIDVALE